MTDPCFLKNGGIVCIIGKDYLERIALLQHCSEYVDDKIKLNLPKLDAAYISELEDEWLLILETMNVSTSIFASYVSNQTLKKLNQQILHARQNHITFFLGFEDSKFISETVRHNIDYFMFIGSLDRQDIGLIFNKLGHSNIPKFSQNEILIMDWNGMFKIMPKVISRKLIDLEIKKLLQQVVFIDVANIICEYEKPSFIVQ